MQLTRRTQPVVRVLCAFCSALSCLALSLPTLGACKIAQVAEWPVNLVDNRPLIGGNIDGQDIIILLDTGSYRSFLFAGAARRLKLPLQQSSNQRVYGSGGAAALLATNVKQLRIGNFTSKNLTLPVLEQTGDAGAGAIAFLLGADFLSAFDTEFDLSHGVVRLLRPEGCKSEQLAYWSSGYFLTQLRMPSGTDQHIETEVSLNGKRVVAWLDTGSPISFVSKPIAVSVGIALGGDDARPAEPIRGRNLAIPSWQGRFDTLAIGNETIRNARLRIADLFSNDTVSATGSMLPQQAAAFPDILLGVDFLQAHRAVLLPRDHQMLFTYNGGPIFRSPTKNAINAAPAPGDGTANPPAAAHSQ